MKYMMFKSMKKHYDSLSVLVLAYNNASKMMSSSTAEIDNKNFSTFGPKGLRQKSQHKQNMKEHMLCTGTKQVIQVNQ